MIDYLHKTQLKKRRDTGQCRERKKQKSLNGPRKGGRRGDRDSRKRGDGSLPSLPLGVDHVAAGHVDTES